MAQVKNPAVDLPIGIVGSLLVCAFLYALMCVVICLMVPYDQVRTCSYFHCSDYNRNWPYKEVLLARPFCTACSARLKEPPDHWSFTDSVMTDPHILAAAETQPTAA